MAADEPRGARLDLPLLSRAVLDALGAEQWSTVRALLPYQAPDEWPGSTPWTARFRAGQLAADPSLGPWLLRAMVLRDQQVMVGHVGLHGPPDERGFVEIGYTVFPSYRRQGFAEEAARALFAWAGRQPGVVGARASVGPWNQPSLRLVAKLGLTEVGRQWDEEDGEEIVYEGSLPLPA